MLNWLQQDKWIKHFVTNIVGHTPHRRAPVLWLNVGPVRGINTLHSDPPPPPPPSPPPQRTVGSSHRTGIYCVSYLFKTQIHQTKVSYYRIMNLDKFDSILSDTIATSFKYSMYALKGRVELKGTWSNSQMHPCVGGNPPTHIALSKSPNQRWRPPQHVV